MPNHQIPILNDFEVGYIAGLLDGEGTLDVRRHGKTDSIAYHCARMRVASTNRVVISWLKSKLGGVICTSKPTSNRLPCYTHVLENITTLKYLLPLLIPHLIIKKEKAEELLIFIKLAPERRRQHNREAAIKYNIIQNIRQSGMLNQYKRI